nr:PREDICTED: uncharacterized protein LOC107076073 [Lepisosteus oculatus]
MSRYWSQRIGRFFISHLRATTARTFHSSSSMAYSTYYSSTETTVIEQRFRFLESTVSSQGERISKLEEEMGTILSSQNTRYDCQNCDKMKRETEWKIKTYEGKLEEGRKRDQMYEEELENTKKQLQAAEKYNKEFDDFRRRMQNNISLEIDRDGYLSENINDPCRETELVKKYDLLKPQVRKHIVEGKHWETKLNIIKSAFDASQKDMDERLKLIKQAFSTPKDSAVADQKFSDGALEAVKSLQKSFFRCSSSIWLDLTKEMIPKHRHASDITESFKTLVAECYCLSCLMALSNPRLEVVWDDDMKSNNVCIFPAVYSAKVLRSPAEVAKRTY